jgi:hypothetical protein
MKLHLAGAALVLSVFVACSGAVEPAKITAAEACAEFAKLSCAKAAECLPFELSTQFGDTQTCEARRTANCKAELASTGVSRTPDAVSACAKDTKTSNCPDGIIGKTVASCATSTGSLNEKDACNFNAQCSSTYCKPIPGTGCGTCAKRQAVGALCSNTAECEVGALCSQQKCTLPANFGEDCAQEKPCAGSLKCIERKCAQPLAIGVACAGEPCTPGAYCSGSTNTCTAYAVSLANETCGSVQGKLSSCKAAGFCGSQAGATCLPSAADGGGCDDVNGPRCMFPASCVAGKCTLPQETVCKK